MNVLFVTHYADLLGANRSLLAFVIYLKKNTQYHPVVLLPQTGGLLEELKKNKIDHYKYHIYPSVYERKNFRDVIKGGIRECISLLISFRLYFLFKDKNIKLIHTNSSVSNVGAYLSVMLKVPHVWHFREFVKQHYKLSHNWGEIYQIYLWNKCACTIITTSNILKDYYSSLLKSNLVTIYNGISAVPLSSAIKRRDFFDIALVGIIHPGKHQDIVLKAISKVIYQYGIDNLHLHIYGNFINEKYRTYILKLVTDEKISNYVTFHGYQPNVIQQTRSYHIGVLASEYEAFGRVTIEYMLNKLIPVVSNSGANTEIVHNGINGFVFNLNDTESLADCIADVIRKYNSLDYMLENIERTANLFSVETNANNILSQYHNILK